MGGAILVCHCVLFWWCHPNDKAVVKLKINHYSVASLGILIALVFMACPVYALYSGLGSAYYDDNYPDTVNRSYYLGTNATAYGLKNTAKFAYNYSSVYSIRNRTLASGECIAGTSFYYSGTYGTHAKTAGWVNVTTNYSTAGWDGTTCDLIVESTGTNRWATIASWIRAPTYGTVPSAGFSCTPLSGNPPKSIACYDESTGPDAVTSWDWKIYNQNTSALAYSGTTQNITTILYDTASYNVSLTATNAFGSDIEVKEHYINLGVNASEYQNGTYTITVSPETVGVGGGITVVADALNSFDNVFAYMLSGLPSSGDATYGALCNGYPPYWYKVGGDWKQYDGDDYTIDWGSEFPVTTTFTANQPGTYTVQGRFWDDQGTGGSGGAVATDTITITGQGEYANITFRVISGASGAELSGSNINIKQSGSGTWTNSTTSNGRLTFPALKGIWYSYQASAAGYQTSDLANAFWDADTTVPIRLTPITSVGEDNWTLWASVNNANGVSLSGATVRLSDGQAKTTGSSGVVSFTVLDGGDYTVTAMRTGYQSQEQSGTVEEGSDYFYFALQTSDNADDDDDGIPNEDDDDDDGDGVPDVNDPDSPGYSGGNGSYSPGALNEAASGGLMEMMTTLINLWPLGLVLVILAAFKRL